MRPVVSRAATSTSHPSTAWKVGGVLNMSVSSQGPDYPPHPNEWADLRCPECGSGSIALILYGRPEYHRQRRVRRHPDKYYFGGCVIDIGDCAVWYCNDCQLRWGPGATPRRVNRWEMP
jgi:hypothetical protein